MNYISPRLEDADKRKRTPEQALRDIGRTDAIRNVTYFTLFARWPREVRLFSVEGPMIETMAECLDAVRQNENTVLVFQNDYDVPRRDVTEEIARMWLDDFTGTEDELPNFIRDNVSEDEIGEHFDSIADDLRHARGCASVETVGRY